MAPGTTVTGDLALSAAIALSGGLVVGASLLWLGRRERARREARAAMAARRGWGIAETAAEGGRGRRITLAGDELGGWRCTASRLASRGGHSGSEWTEWQSSGRTGGSGLWVAGPPLAPGEAEMAAGLLGALDSGTGRMLLRRMIGEAAELAPGLVHVPRPGGRDRPFTLLVTAPGAAGGPDLDALADCIGRWRADHPGAGLHPVVIAGPDGVRLRLDRALADAAALEAFADTALAIAALFPGRGGAA